jgi:hypothetical protein
MASRGSRIDDFVGSLHRIEHELIPAFVSFWRALCAGIREILKELTFLAVSVLGLVAIIWWVLSRVPWRGF